MKFAVTFETDEDGFVVASCPALPGCHSQGKTKDEALENIKDAIQGFVVSMRKHGAACAEHNRIGRSFYDVIDASRIPD